MPLIGIIRGFGEGEVATGYIIKLIKALKRRFRTKIDYCEIPLGNYIKYGDSIDSQVVAQMRSCDVIFAGDMYSRENPIAYSVNDVAMALDNNIEFACISGIGSDETIDIHIASYFDGGFALRDGVRTVDGCRETRICSTFSAMNIVRSVSSMCENSRRRLFFVKDSDNEYCSDLFYSKFSDLTLPLSNFRLFNYTISDICYEMMYDLKQFDYIFASKTFAEYAMGICRFKMQNNFASYYKFGDQKSVYTVKSINDNSPAGNYVPTMKSYIAALCELLKTEFNLNKESCALRRCMNDAAMKLPLSDDCDEFIAMIKEELNKNLTSTYNTSKPVKSRYIRK